MVLNIRFAGRIWLGLLLAALVSSCGVISRNEPAEQEVFRAPTQAVSLTSPSATPTQFATATPISVEFHPTATPVCSDALTFIEDLTIPDGMQVSLGAVLDKRWRVENSGTCNWDESYSIQRTAGQELGAPERLALYPARSGTETMLRIQFIAPEEPGTYRSAWQAYNPLGEAFGDPFYVEFTVSP